MNCAESLGLLSEYHDGELDGFQGLQVQEHLDGCPPCAGVYSDLRLIVVTAVEIRYGADIRFPDEMALWRKLEIIHQVQ